MKKNVARNMTVKILTRPNRENTSVELDLVPQSFVFFSIVGMSRAKMK